MIDLNNSLKVEMNGYTAYVKPKSLLARKVDKELREELKEWQEKNNAEYVKWSQSNAEAIERALKDDNYTASVFDNAPQSNDWLEDEEFRAKRFKKMSDACMKFEKEPPTSIWKSDELEYGVIELAWGFFTGKREVPMNMLYR